MTRDRLRSLPGPHRWPIALALWVGVWLGALSGCASSVAVDVRDQDALVAKQRWAWAAPVDQSAAERPAAPAGIRALVVQAVERAVNGRGYAKATEAPEFRIDLRIHLRLEIEQWEETSAVGFLPSMDHTPSYEYQTSESKEARYERVTVQVRILEEETGRLLWRGRLEGRYAGRFAERVADEVERLMRSLPWADDPAEPDPGRRPAPATAGLRVAPDPVSLCERSEAGHPIRALADRHLNRGHP